MSKQIYRVSPELHAKVRTEFDSAIAPLLEPVPDGAGRARAADLKHGWITGLDMVRIPPAELDAFPALQMAIFELRCKLYDILQPPSSGRDVRQIIVNYMNPGSVLDVHKDGPIPQTERWHYVVQTNSEVQYEEGPTKTTMKAYHFPEGNWCGPIIFTDYHRMSNLGNGARVHYVVDVPTVTE